MGSDKNNYLTLEDVELKNKRVLLRIDVNSPMDPVSKRILDDSRFRSHVGTLKALRNSKTVLLAHQSRPGRKDFTTMEKHASKLSEILNREVKYIDDIFGKRAQKEINKMNNGDIIFLENIRFYSEEVLEREDEKQKETFLVKNLSPLFNYYINDAFAAAHRPHPSIVGFPQTLPSLAGKLMEKEIKTLESMIEDNGKTYFVLGGVKVKDSLKVMENLLERDEASKIFTTGVLSILFLDSKGIDIGKKNKEFLENEIEYQKQSKRAIELLEKYQDKIEIPEDVAINKEGEREDVSVEKIPDEYRIEDIGIETIVNYSEKLKDGQKIVMNGPAGVFEKDKFSIGTEELQRTTTESEAYSIIGGGHICTAAEECGLKNYFDHVSTGGGALMNFFSSDQLPALRLLEESKEMYS
ncbi:phosphoglycerate kinase [archaeon SCG-AAA382B04]|nr:phosphoglycerate kinase [archaeon SCG-AAA382B04]